MSPPRTASTRPIWINALIALVVCAVVAFDYYDRHPATCQDCLKSYGMAGGVAWADVDPTGIQRFSDGYKLYLVVQTGWASIDYMTDTVIAKSAPYTISTQELALEIPKPKLRIATGQINNINFNLVVLPNDISIDQILTLGDVKKLGGKIVAGKSVQIPLQADQSGGSSNPSTPNVIQPPPSTASKTQP